MKQTLPSAIEAIGETPLVELSRMTHGLSGRILAKLDYLNPGFSKKDRIARQIIEDAEASGELQPGQTVVELTSGNTGTGLAIVCAVKDRPGALLKLLKPFSDAGINMTKIESRPDKKKIWEYNFYIDFMGHTDDAVVWKALDRIKSETLFLKILGSYPVGT